MSVPKGKRTESKTEFFDHAYYMAKSLIMYMAKDFGAKTHVKDLKTFTYNAKFSKEDKEKFIRLCERYEVDVESSYPRWILEEFRTRLMEELFEFIHNITEANTIYPNTLSEFNLRRNYQWKAIGNCYEILVILRIAIDVFHPNIEKYMPYVDMIEREINLLRRWKKSDNRLLKGINKRIVENEDYKRERELNEKIARESLIVPPTTMPNIMGTINNPYYSNNNYYYGQEPFCPISFNRPVQVCPVVFDKPICPVTFN